ncbi:MAG: hypothetical protein KAG96_01330 [Ichthyobacteriaceae bacterium]|nr:hypothetical protein [Ichthyobacteriaceae bacterium]
MIYFYKKTFSLFLFFGLFLTTVNAQYNSRTSREFGGSANISVMSSDHHFVIGRGLKMDNRINIAHSHFTIKNSLGITVYSNTNIEEGAIKGYDYLYMLDAMVEYNLHKQERPKSANYPRHSPYIGLGFNGIFRDTKPYLKNITPEPGVFITVKGSLGYKFKIGNQTTMYVEGYLEWDFSDNLDNQIHNTVWYQFDHTANISIGFAKRFGNEDLPRLPWSGALNGFL